jgi:DNA polymerase (family 10)
MGADNAKIAEAFNHLADLLEIEEANPFRVRAYRNAARVVTGLPQDVGAMLAAGADLTELPGIGKDLASKIAELAKTGRLAMLREVEREVPGELGELLKLPGLGPKRVRALNRRLKIKTVADLERAIGTGKLDKLAGFGVKTIAGLRDALQRRRSSGAPARFAWIKADAVVRELVPYLRGADGLTLVTPAGSYRRHAETVGDLDLLVTAPKPAAVIRRFVAYPGARRIIAEGATRAAIELQSGLQVDLRAVPAESYGAALHYFTGSKAHNLAVRARAIKQGLKVNEYGIYKGARRIAGRTEEDVYAAVGLPYIEPELRENSGELEAAEAGRLPRLVNRADIKGDLHVHSAASDGTASIAAMVEQARVQGLSYIAVCDHTQRLKVAHGLDAKRLAAQIKAIAALNGKLKGFTVLSSAEVDILPDGTLDLPDAVLADLDVVVCAVHTALNLPRDKQTERILRAMDHKHCAILAHPTGRLIGLRQAYDVDLDRVITAAKANGVVLEINGQPDRLDLDAVHARAAQAAGVKLAVVSDAHSPAQLDYLGLAVAQARRAWLEASDIINTRSAAEMRKLLRR